MSAQPSSPGPAMPEPPDYTRYDAYLAGFTGLDQNEICRWTRQPARRSHIGPRGMYKTGLTRLANGDLLACPCTETTKGGKWPITVFRSRDEGETWQRVETQGDQLLGKEPALATLSDGRVLLLTSHPHGFRVSRSDDRGQVVGSIHPVHWIGRKAIVELPEYLPLEVQVFITGLVFSQWKKQTDKNEDSYH